MHKCYNEGSQLSDPKTVNGDGSGPSLPKHVIMEPKSENKNLGPTSPNHTPEIEKERIKCTELVSNHDFLMDLAENVDRSGSAATFGSWCGQYSYAQGGCYTGDGRVAKAAKGVRATSGYAFAEWSLLKTYAEGPHVGVAMSASNLPGTPIAAASALGVASLGKVGVRAGPLHAEANLNANTGLIVGTTHLELCLLGFGFSLGRRTSLHSPVGSVGLSL